METYFAHSAQDGYPAQSYYEHITNVYKLAVQFASDAVHYSTDRDRQLERVVALSAEYHDLGKLNKQNQEVLRDIDGTRRALPQPHVDAGAAFLLKKGLMIAACIIYSHHAGLPDFSGEALRKTNCFRDKSENTRILVDKELVSLLHIHEKIIKINKAMIQDQKNPFQQTMFFRMALSCLADADHSDTAAVYGQYPKNMHEPELFPRERLAALDRYISRFKKKDKRSILRGEMYIACRNFVPHGSISSCDSPVGSGKTTAVMAHLLKQAELKKARRIFVVLPYTNIIEQSVRVYRDVLVLPGEDPEAVVAELHHKADFEDERIRYLTSLWRAPIVVTTAVAFFETLASSKPSALRRLHELPGSMIFVDEAHASVPIHLLPITWKWMNVLASEWGCYWLLASGSLVRFWEIEKLMEDKNKVIEDRYKDNIARISEIVPPDLRNQLMNYEMKRISFCFQSTPISRKGLIEWVMSKPGPRLLIMNTVQSAAVIAEEIRKKYGRKYVEHLSTALTAVDRAGTIERIRKRLFNETDVDWVLVATSCVEAGVDFSFKTGFREMSSLLSLLQSSGRINRHGLDDNAEMWSFTMQDDVLLKRNPGVKNAASILQTYFEYKASIKYTVYCRSVMPI